MCLVGEPNHPVSKANHLYAKRISPSATTLRHLFGLFYLDIFLQLIMEFLHVISVGMLVSFLNYFQTSWVCVIQGRKVICNFFPLLPLHWFIYFGKEVPNIFLFTCKPNQEQILVFQNIFPIYSF